MAVQLNPIKPKRVSDQVFERLQELILRGELKPDERLLPERELAQALRVSRTTVRNALSRLAFMGLVEPRQGKGTFVRSLESQNRNPLVAAMRNEAMPLEEIMEVRMGLECSAAALAEERATSRDIQLLESCLEEMKEAMREGRGEQADVAFHMAISFATKNPLQVHMMRLFYDYLTLVIYANQKRLIEKYNKLEIAMKQHSDIVRAIQSGDKNKAFNAMKYHIGYIQTFIINESEGI